MKVLIATDITIYIHDESIYAPKKYSTIFRRYERAFGKLVICSRKTFVNSEAVISYDNITDIVDSIIPIGLLGCLTGKYNKIIKKEVASCSLAIVRCPSLCAYLTSDCAKKESIPVLSEAMGCAWDTYWNHGLVGKLLAPYMFFKMKNVVSNADYALYVTEKALQNRYPTKCRSVGVSNVNINVTSDEIVNQRRERFEQLSSVVNLMTTGAVNVKYKGQQYVLYAMSRLKHEGILTKYFIVGEGDNTYLRELVQKLGLEENVVFTGGLALDEVMNLLDRTDIYIQPSLSEGLPRAVVEAMSRGCPCLCTPTLGGIELAQSSMIIRKKNHKDIEKFIKKYICMTPEEKYMLSNYSFKTAERYVCTSLNEKRNSYFEYIKENLRKIE